MNIFDNVWIFIIMITIGFRHLTKCIKLEKKSSLGEFFSVINKYKVYFKPHMNSYWLKNEWEPNLKTSDKQIS